MTIEIARNFFFWCSIINYGLLLIWALPFAFWRDGLFRWWWRWVPVSREQFNMLNIGGISFYKIAIFLFNIVPCVALYLVASGLVFQKMDNPLTADLGPFVPRS